MCGGLPTILARNSFHSPCRQTCGHDSGETGSDGGTGDARCVFTDRHEVLNPALCREPADRGVLVGCGLTQLEHVSQHSPGVPTRPAELSQGRQRGTHRIGIGVVGVVDHSDAI